MFLYEEVMQDPLLISRSFLLSNLATFSSSLRASNLCHFGNFCYSVFLTSYHSFLEALGISNLTNQNLYILSQIEVI